MLIRIVAAYLAVGGSAAAHAATSGVHIPEPGDAALFALAVAGLVIGRQASKRPPSAK